MRNCRFRFLGYIVYYSLDVADRRPFLPDLDTLDKLEEQRDYVSWQLAIKKTKDPVVKAFRGERLLEENEARGQKARRITNSDVELSSTLDVPVRLIRASGGKEKRPLPKNFKSTQTIVRASRRLPRPLSNGARYRSRSIRGESEQFHSQPRQNCYLESRLRNGFRISLS